MTRPAPSARPSLELVCKRPTNYGRPARLMQTARSGQGRGGRSAGGPASGDFLELNGVQPRIEIATPQQFVMAADIQKAAAVHDDDAVGQR